jgi:hypothetical protein
MWEYCKAEKINTLKKDQALRHSALTGVHVQCTYMYERELCGSLAIVFLKYVIWKTKERVLKESHGCGSSVSIGTTTPISCQLHRQAATAHAHTERRKIKRKKDSGHSSFAAWLMVGAGWERGIG